MVKKVLIFTGSQDQGPGEVMRWLARLGCEVIRFNYDRISENPTSVEMTLDSLRFCFEGIWHEIGEFESIWFRKCRREYWFSRPVNRFHMDCDRVLAEMLPSKIEQEETVAAKYFYSMIDSRDIRRLGNPHIMNPNKLNILAGAREVGLNVPDTIVSNSVPEHIRAHPDRFITKALSTGVYLWDKKVDQKGYFSYTERLSDLDPSSYSEEYFPISCFQQLAPKAFEVRSFYLDGQFSNVAIFSQGDEQTEIDYRKYNLTKPNRTVPIELPNEVAEKVVRFFKSIDLNTGSVDFIVNDLGEYTFLEVNPSGIYSYMDFNCNLRISEKIAFWLGGEN